MKIITLNWNHNVHLISVGVSMLQTKEDNYQAFKYNKRIIMIKVNNLKSYSISI